MSWTPERVAELIKLWGEGHTCAAIAMKLGGVTRNAVIGKAGRIGLPNRPNPIKRSDGTPKPVKPRVLRNISQRRGGIMGSIALAANKAAPVARKFAVKLGAVSECRWPEGDPKHPGFHFCEAKTEPGRPYCQAHCERAYQKPEQENTRRMAAE